ncbi:cyclic-di-AMP receptor [Oenococcus alcoholitolerans]|uniref:cyclic-di-AMP receptor n=1 Tax=Oenococcus alcoholitolerans TaxID=931074 RepID=UPI003F6EDBB3
MKLITAIVQDKDASAVANALVENNIRATRLASAGGFLRSGNSTFLIAVNDDKVDQTIDVIKEHSKTRKQFVTPPIGLDMSLDTVGEPIEVEIGGATVIVQEIEDFQHF